MPSTNGNVPIIDFQKDSLENLRTLYDQYGLVRIDNVYTNEEVEEMHNAMTKILKEMDPDQHPRVIFTSDENPKNAKDIYFLESSDKIRFFYEDGAFNEKGDLLVEKEKAINKIGHALHWLNPIFKKYTFHDKIKKIAHELELKQPHIVQSMYICKQPKIGDAVHEHIDSWYLTVEPNYALHGIWLPIEDATQENGCLWFIPGSHKNRDLNYFFVRDTEKDPNKPLCKYIGEKPTFDSSQYIPAPVPRGSIVLIHGLVVHKSEPNRSNVSRHAYTYHIADFDHGKWSPLSWPQETPTYKFPPLYDVNV